MFYVKSANNGNKLCIISLSQCQHSQQVAVAVGEEEEGEGEGGGGEWELKLQLDSFDGLWGLAPACCQNRFSVRFVVCAFQMESIILLCVICDLCESLRFESQQRRVLPQLKSQRGGREGASMSSPFDCQRL